MDNNQTQLDPEVINLAKAIRQSESGGDFTATGKSGEYGAYQFTPDTWNASSMKYLGQHVSLQKATREQQNEVAYKQIKEWKDAGNNIGQVASMWNAGATEPDAYLGTFSNGQSSKGVNKHGASFDVPAYAKSVASAYHTIKSGGQARMDPNNPSATDQTTSPGPVAIGQGLTQAITGQSETGELASRLGGVAKGIGGFLDMLVRPFENIAAIPVQAGVAGWNALTGQRVQDPYATQGIPGFTGKQKLSDVTSKQGLLGKLSSGLEVATDVGLASGAGGLLNMIRGGTALASPIVAESMKGFKMSMPEFQALTSQEKVNALSEALTYADDASKPILQQAAREALAMFKKENGIGSFSELNPKLAKAFGLSWTALKNLVKLSLPAAIGAEGAALYNKLTK